MSMINADENFEKLGLTLPPAPAPAGVYTVSYTHLLMTIYNYMYTTN